MSLNELELLAPAGNMDVLPSVIDAGADAIYLGGKRFNMRGLRADFNFTDAEIIGAVDLIHRSKRKVYITINNLYNGAEIDEISSYLIFLKDLGVDAIIVQDLGIVALCEKLNLDIPLHASVQMGIANLEAVKLLEEKAFQRVILSKNLSLEEIKAISNHTSLGIEIFIHGDLCISHTGHCLMSSFVSGQSGNRGKCRKPCRWEYQLQGKTENYSPYEYALAHKDLCLYPYISDLINAGVSSFKIEGRMRSADYLSKLISTYRRAIDRFKDDPASYSMDEDEMLALQEHRIRDYTTGNLIEPMGREGIGFDGTREPIFISQAQPLRTLSLDDYNREVSTATKFPVPELTIQAGDPDNFANLLSLGADNIILGSEALRTRQNWTLQSIGEATAMAKDCKTRLFLETPLIVSQNDLEEVRRIRSIAESGYVQGVVVNDLGSLKLFRNSGLEVWGGYGLNIFNYRAASFYLGLGLSRISASLELDDDDLKLLLDSGNPIELLVHGPLPALVSDYCIIRGAQLGQEEGDCALHCLDDEYSLVDRYEQKYKIITDHNCRNQLFHPYELCLFPYLLRLSSWGVRSFRIDGQYYPPKKLVQVASIYRKALAGIAKGEFNTQDDYTKLMELFPEGLAGMTFVSQGD